MEAVYVLGNVEVEAGIVYKYDAVWLPLADVELCPPHVPEDGGQMAEHREETHVGQFAVVAHKCAADGRHLVAANESELRLGITPLQCHHQVRGMEIATGLTGYQVITHEFSFFHSFILSFFHSFILSFFHSSILSFFHSFILPFFHSFILPFFHSFILSFPP